MNRYIRWILLNGAMMGTFIVGSLLPHSGLLNVGFVLVYITIGAGLFALVSSLALRNDAFDEAFRKNPDILDKPVNRKVDIGFDITMTGVIAFFGYPILAIWYAIHAVGLHLFLVRVSEAKRRFEEREQ